MVAEASARVTHLSSSSGCRQIELFFEFLPNHATNGPTVVTFCMDVPPAMLQHPQSGTPRPSRGVHPINKARRESISKAAPVARLHGNRILSADISASALPAAMWICKERD